MTEIKKTLILKYNSHAVMSIKMYTSITYLLGMLEYFCNIFISN